MSSSKATSSSSSSSSRPPINPPKNLPLITSIPQDAPPDMPDEDTKDISNDEVKAWLNKLYEDGIKMSDKDVLEVYDLYKYKGFDRNDTLKLLKKHVPDTKTAIHLILICSLNGPQRAAGTKLFNGKTPLQMGIPASGGQGKRLLTCNKISAATADLAAYYMKKSDVPKRLDGDLPGWLQFPAAGSIRLPEYYRRAHLDFARRFSEVIGGTFQPQIYDQMVRNNYLDERLNLFT